MEPLMNVAPNKVVCPECGKVRLETPPGTRALPTLGMARKASGAAGACGCGKHRPAGPAPEATNPAGPEASSPEAIGDAQAPREGDPA